MQHRSGAGWNRIRIGAILLLAAPVQFVLAMLVVEAGFPGYSPVQNFVSDLGATASPWAWLFNLSLWVLGTLALSGTLLVRREFPSGRWSRVGVGALGVAWAFAFLVGVFPEQAGAVHTNVSAVAFLSAGVALGAMGIAMWRHGRWGSLAAFTVGCGVVTLGSFLVFASQQGEGSFAGVWERLIIAPILLWSVVVAYRLLAGGPSSWSSWPSPRSRAA